MLSSEFLIEAISLTKFKTQALRAYRDAVLDTMSDLYDDLDGQDFENAKSDFNGDHITKYIRAPLKDFFQIHLKRHLEDKLTAVARAMVGSGNVDRRGSWVKVEFQDTNSNLGVAYPDNTAALSETAYLNKIIDGIVEPIINFAIDSRESSEQSFLEPIKHLIKQLPTDRRLQELVTTDWNGSEILEKLIRTFIHEVTHVAQHLPQQKKGMDTTDYTSYLAKKKEFYKSFEQDPVTKQYRDPQLMSRLHAASPQEIGAFTHNLAMEISEFLGWEDDLENVKYYNSEEHHNNLIHTIRNFLTDRGITMKTPAEVAVFRRYLKMVYVELERYRRYLLDQARKKEMPGDSEASDIKSKIKSRLGAHPRPVIPKE